MNKDLPHHKYDGIQVKWTPRIQKSVNKDTQVPSEPNPDPNPRPNGPEHICTEKKVIIDITSTLIFLNKNLGFLLVQKKYENLDTL